MYPPAKRVDATASNAVEESLLLGQKVLGLVREGGPGSFRIQCLEDGDCSLEE